MSKAVPGKFHGSGGNSKQNCLQDWANFHRSQAWQIILIFNTASSILVNIGSDNTSLCWITINDILCHSSKNNSNAENDIDVYKHEITAMPPIEQIELWLQSTQKAQQAQVKPNLEHFG